MKTTSINGLRRAREAGRDGGCYRDIGGTLLVSGKSSFMFHSGLE